jgi:hypothetical protein
MKQVCSECDRRVHVLKKGYLPDHDLCDRCWRTLRARVVALRLQPKPNWAVRDSLRMLEAQARKNPSGASPQKETTADPSCRLGERLCRLGAPTCDGASSSNY